MPDFSKLDALLHKTQQGPSGTMAQGLDMCGFIILFSSKGLGVDG